MTTQLRLLDTDPRRFRLDERTRQIGRDGIARARAALQESAQRGERGEAAPAVALDLLVGEALPDEPSSASGGATASGTAPHDPARPADAA